MNNALLVVDVQNDYFAGGAWPQFAAEETLEQIIAAIKAAREKGWVIIAVQHINSDRNAALFAKGSNGAVLHPAISPLLVDFPLVIKRYADAFWHTDLSVRLREAAVSDLYLCGMMTQNCITHTALSPDAVACRVHILAQACSAPSERIHRVALNALSARLDVQ